MNRKVEKAALCGITFVVHFMVVPAVMLYFGVKGKISEIRARGSSLGSD